MEQVIREALKDIKNLDVEIDHDSINVFINLLGGDRRTLFYCEYNQYPDCCGIVILHNFSFTYVTDTLKKVVKVVIPAFIEEMQKDPDEDGPSVADGPYGSIIISDINLVFVNILVELGFEVVNEFENPKTENVISTLIYTVNE